MAICGRGACGGAWEGLRARTTRFPSERQIWVYGVVASGAWGGRQQGMARGTNSTCESEGGDSDSQGTLWRAGVRSNPLQLVAG